MIAEYKSDDSIDFLFNKLNELKEYFITTNHALTAYDSQKYKEMLDKIELSLFELKEKTQPRKKFAFSKKNQIHQNNETQKNDKINSAPKTESTNYFADQIEGVVNLSRESKMIGRENKKTVYKVENNNDSEIVINSGFDCLFIKNNKNCLIKIGPAKSSVFVDNNENCEIHIMGHQVIINKKFMLVY